MPKCQVTDCDNDAEYMLRSTDETVHYVTWHCAKCAKPYRNNPLVKISKLEKEVE